MLLGLFLAEPSWVDEPFNQEKSQGEKATFICRATGIPEPVYTWFIDGIPLEDISGIFKQLCSVLSVRVS